MQSGIFSFYASSLHRHAVRDRLELVHSGPPRHAEEETEIEHRADLGNNLAHRRWRQRTKVAKDEETDHENCVHELGNRTTITNRFDWATIKPGQASKNHHRGSHRHHAPELGIQAEEIPDHGAQNRIERREVPNRCNVRRRLQRICRVEIRGFEEITATFRRPEHHRGENHQENDDADDILDRVVRVERDTITRDTVFILVSLDLHTIRVVRPRFVQCEHVSRNQTDQYEREGNHMEGEETIERCIANDEVATDDQGQITADYRNCREQVNDNLSPPIGHLPPRQQIAKEGFTHQAQEDGNTEQPGQFTRLAVRTVEQPTEHVQIDYDEKSRCAGRVHVANDPATRNIAHDVFNRGECHRYTVGVQGSIRLIVHDQKNTGDNLNDQHQKRQGTKEIPKIEILRGV